MADIIISTHSDFADVTLTIKPDGSTILLTSVDLGDGEFQDDAFQFTFDQAEESVEEYYKAVKFFCN